MSCDPSILLNVFTTFSHADTARNDDSRSKTTIRVISNLQQARPDSPTIPGTGAENRSTSIRCITWLCWSDAPEAFDVARPLEQWDLPPCFGILRRKLEADWGSKGTSQFIQVLRLLEQATLSQLKQAVHKALELGTATPDAVRVILEGLKEPPVALFSLDGRPHLSGVHVAKPDLSAYDDLLPGLIQETNRNGLAGILPGGVA